MKKIKILLIVIISILGLGAGISKVLLLPEEQAFFQKVGLTETAIILVGIIQIIGAVLIFIARFRKIGATLLGITFGFSTILIFMSGDMAFGLFSILPIVFIFFIAKPKKKNMKTLTLSTLILMSAFVTAQTVTDYDGNVYPVVTIGNQNWMAQNLRSTHFSDGTPIVNAGLSNWYFLPLSTPRYCEPSIPPGWTDTTSLGYWYNYPVAGDSRNICPQGWHVATDADWYNMVHFLDPNSDTSSAFTLESQIAGGLLKDTVSWVNPNIGATNASGFSALAVSGISGSISWPAGNVCCQGMDASFWCGGPEWNPGLLSYSRYLTLWNASISRISDTYFNGKSIRCVCDTLTTVSIEENPFYGKLQVYPNPATDKITITASNKPLGKIIIYNTSGVIVYTATSNDNSKLIDVSHLTDGVYLIELLDLNKTIKIIIRQ